VRRNDERNAGHPKGAMDYVCYVTSRIAGGVIRPPRVMFDASQQSEKHGKLTPFGSAEYLMNEIS